MVILVDTNIFIDYLRQKKKTETDFHRFFVEGSHTASISLITVTELWQGKDMKEEKNRQIIEGMLERLEIVLPNLEIAKLTGDLLRESHYVLHFTDAEIAACALYYTLPLLTKNKKDFSKIKELHFFSD